MDLDLIGDLSPDLRSAGERDRLAEDPREADLLLESERDLSIEASREMDRFGERVKLRGMYCL